jgi:type I restriction enzyme S subunit
MNEGWELTTLGKLTSWKSGGTPPKSKNEFWGGDIPWISASSMGGNRYRTSKLKVTQLGVENGAKLAKRNNLLLLVRGSILHQKIQVGIATRDLTFNQDVKALTVREDIDPWFILAWLRGNEWSLLNMVENTGIGAGKLDTTLLQNLPLHLPPIEVRKQITLFFKSIDDKIHLLRQQNATLESMAQALFKSWFVDFDPVIDNALAAGRVLPKALGVRVALRGAVLAGGAYSGLPEEVKSLFPDSFVFSDELGKWIPEGWEAGTLKDVARNPKISVRPENMTDGTPYIGLQDMPQKSIALSRWSVSDEVGSNKYQFEKGDILFGKLRPYFHKVGIAPVDGVCSTDILVIEPTNEAYSSLVLGHVTSVKLIDHVTACSTGTRMPRTNWSDIGRYEIAIPPIEIASYLTTKIQANLSKIDNNIIEIQTLTRLRDVLLPELISGRLGV